MATETATIRVPRRTRDLLTKQAHEQGVSLACLVSDLAREREIAAIWHSERNASLRDTENPDVSSEDREWDLTLVDGIE